MATHSVSGEADPAQRADDDLAVNRGAFVAALSSGDAAAAAALYADDATLIAPAAEVLRGRAAIESFWRTGVETGIVEVRLDVHELSQRGEIAFEVGAYALRLAPESGASIVDRGRYFIVHRVDADGLWRRAAEMFSPDETAAAKAFS